MTGQEGPKATFLWWLGGETGQEMWLWKPARAHPTMTFSVAGVKPQPELPSCVPSWMTEPNPGAFSVPGSLPPRFLLTRYAGQRPGRKWVQQRAPVHCLWGTTPRSNHWLHEGENGKTWDALKTGSEMLWVPPSSPVCGSHLGFWNHNSHWEAPSPPAEGSTCLWMVT